MSDELLGHDAIVAQFLEHSRDSLKIKTFPGDVDHEKGPIQPRDWFVSTCSAIGIINDTISRIYMEETCTTQNSH